MLAREVKPELLPEMSWDFEWGTNMHHALLLGRRMLQVYPFVPLSPQGHALSIGVVSYDGGVFFGATLP